jgi:hypothetical protein
MEFMNIIIVRRSNLKGGIGAGGKIEADYHCLSTKSRSSVLIRMNEGRKEGRKDD